MLNLRWGDRVGYLSLNKFTLDKYRRSEVVSEFSRLETRCPSVRPIERALREPRMDPQSIVFLAQP